MTKTKLPETFTASMLKKLSRRAELEAAAKEFEKLDKEVKEELKPLGPMVEIGPFLIQNVDKTMTQYDVPAEVKAPYARVKQYIQTTITKVS